MQLRMVIEVIQHGHDGCNARLVISAQKSRSVGDDQALAGHFFQHRRLRRGESHSGIIEHDVSAVIVFDHSRLHAGSAAVRRSVHVGQESDGRDPFLLIIGRKRRIDIAMLVHLRILQPQFFQLPDQPTAYQSVHISKSVLPVISSKSASFDSPDQFLIYAPLSETPACGTCLPVCARSGSLSERLSLRILRQLKSWAFPLAFCRFGRPV